MEFNELFSIWLMDRYHLKLLQNTPMKPSGWRCLADIGQEPAE